jgi:hypothetical protein
MANDLDCVDAHRDDGKRFIARSDEKLTAFQGLEEGKRVTSKHLTLALRSPSWRKWRDLLRIELESAIRRKRDRSSFSLKPLSRHWERIERLSRATNFT